MRMIDADKLCEDLLSRWNIADTRKEELIRQVMADIVTPIVVSQPTVNQWIPVSERLPNKPSGDEYYWCSSHKADVPACEYIVMIKGAELPTALFWDGCHWFDIDGNETLYPVAAWQPLPEPWKGEEE